MKIVLRNLTLMLKWNIENNGSFVEKAMLEESIREVQEKIASDLDNTLNNYCEKCS